MKDRAHRFKKLLLERIGVPPNTYKPRILILLEGLWGSLVSLRASGARDPGANPGSPILKIRCTRSQVSKARCALRGLKAAVWGGARALDARGATAP